jgi:hypothetical protein
MVSAFTRIKHLHFARLVYSMVQPDSQNKKKTISRRKRL